MFDIFGVVGVVGVTNYMDNYFVHLEYRTLSRNISNCKL